MSTILLVAEQLDGTLQNATLGAAGFARAAAELEDGEVIGLVIGHGARGAADELANYVSKVICLEGDVFANYLAETWAPAVAAIASEVDADIIATPSTTTGKDFLPRVAARLAADENDVGFVADVIEVYEDSAESQLAFKRPIWAGNLIECVTSDGDVTCVTVRTTNFSAPAADAGGTVEERAFTVEASAGTEFVSFDRVVSDRPALTDADVVVSGGRGLKSAEAFEIIESLADTLGAAVGASRAAVDSGYAPNDWQVGQTGKIVAPNLYVAVAISGAIQHLAGMKGSKVIVAINKDAEAPIFQVADFGLVADAFKVVPELTEKLQARKG
jgi:electron transfer flavoprotein alpha subunit